MTVQVVRNASNALLSTDVVGGGPRGLWAKGVGGFSRLGADHGYNYGAIGGYGLSVGPHKKDVIGAALSYNYGSMGTSAYNKMTNTNYGLWLYGDYFSHHDHWKISGALGGGWSSNDMDSASLGLPMQAQFGGHWLSAAARVSYWTSMYGLEISPRLSLGYNQVWTNRFNTRGASFLNVHAASSSFGSMYLEPALLIGKRINTGNTSWYPQVRLGMVENIGSNPSIALSSGQVHGSMTGIGMPHTQGMAELRVDWTPRDAGYDFGKGLEGNIAVKQLFGGGASSTQFMATLKYNW